MFGTFFSWLLHYVQSPSVVSKIKNYDTTKFNKNMIKIINEQHEALINYNCKNPKNKRNMLSLAKELNALLGLNKCVSSYARVWNKKESVSTET